MKTTTIVAVLFVLLTALSTFVAYVVQLPETRQVQVWKPTQYVRANVSALRWSLPGKGTYFSFQELKTFVTSLPTNDILFAGINSSKICIKRKKGKKCKEWSEEKRVSAAYAIASIGEADETGRKVVSWRYSSGPVVKIPTTWTESLLFSSRIKIDQAEFTVARIFTGVSWWWWGLNIFFGVIAFFAIVAPLLPELPEESTLKAGKKDKAKARKKPT